MRDPHTSALEGHMEATWSIKIDHCIPRASGCMHIRSGKEVWVGLLEGDLWPQEGKWC